LLAAASHGASCAHKLAKLQPLFLAHERGRHAVGGLLVCLHKGAGWSTRPCSLPSLCARPYPLVALPQYHWELLWMCIMHELAVLGVKTLSLTHRKGGRHGRVEVLSSHKGYSPLQRPPVLLPSLLHLSDRPAWGTPSMPGGALLHQEEHSLSVLILCKSCHGLTALLLMLAGMAAPAAGLQSKPLQPCQCLLPHTGWEEHKEASANSPAPAPSYLCWLAGWQAGLPCQPAPPRSCLLAPASCPSKQGLAVCAATQQVARDQP